MDEIWGLFRKRETSLVALIIALVVLVFSVIGSVQNYHTTYEQLARAFGTEFGLTFTVLSQAVEFFVPILLAWGIMKALSIHQQIRAFVVVTGVVAWLTDAVTAFMHFFEASQSALALRILWSLVGSFLFVTMEIWVMLSAAATITAWVMLTTGQLPGWVTNPSSAVETPRFEMRPSIRTMKPVGFVPTASEEGPDPEDPLGIIRKGHPLR